MCHHYKGREGGEKGRTVREGRGKRRKGKGYEPAIEVSVFAGFLTTDNEHI